MNRVIRARVFAWVCTLILLVSGVPAIAQAKQPQKVQKIAYTKAAGKTARKLFQNSLKAGSEKYVKQRASYPESYDLRTLNLLTPVKDQGKTGLCWAFAACAAMESNALKQGLGTFDLSENHLAWFAYNSGNCPLPGLEGDTNYLTGTLEEDGKYVKVEWYNAGGDSWSASQSIMNGYGPVLESDSPVNPGVAAQTVPSAELASGHNVLTLKATYEIPGKNINAIKDAIMNNGAVVTGICSDSFLNWEKYDDKYFNENTYAAYYDGADELPNDHDVCIVGWDDNFSKENFGTVKPKKNGAWLLRNSWGTDDWTNDKGYFWVSYEDYGINNETIFSYVVGPKDAYESIYQYDGGLSKGYWYDGSLGAANVYTARKNEKIVAVTNYMDPCSGTVTIYENPGEKIPVGKKLTSQKFRVENRGQSTIVLEKPVTVQKGTRFAVVFKFDKAVCAYIDSDDDEETKQSLSKDGNGGFLQDITAKEGESYVLTDGWFTGDDFNCCIKALALNGGMMASTPDSGSILLSWNEVKDAAGYEIYRKTGAEEYTLLTTAEKDQTTYLDETAEVGVSYDYKMVPKLASGAGEEQTTSMKAVLFAPQKLTTKKTSKMVTLKWGAVNKAVKYEVYRKVKGGSYKKVSTVKTVTYKDKKVKKGKTYSYYVVAVATNGSKSAKSAVKTIRF